MYAPLQVSTVLSGYGTDKIIFFLTVLHHFKFSSGKLSDEIVSSYSLPNMPGIRHPISDGSSA